MKIIKNEIRKYVMGLLTLLIIFIPSLINSLFFYIYHKKSESIFLYAIIIKFFTDFFDKFYLPVYIEI